MRWEKVSPFLGGSLWASGEGTVQPPRWLRAHLPAPMCPAPSSLTWGQAREQCRLNLDQRTLIWGWVAYPNHGEAQRWGWMRGKTDTPEIHCATTHTEQLGSAWAPGLAGRGCSLAHFPHLAQRARAHLIAYTTNIQRAGLCTPILTPIALDPHLH